ncbi:MAG: hypothetical protein R3B09_16400 [Nannocystaceae bacterium]
MPLFTRSPLRTPLVLAALALACGDSGGETGASSTGITSASATTTAGASASATSTGGGSASEATTAGTVGESESATGTASTTDASTTGGTTTTSGTGIKLDVGAPDGGVTETDTDSNGECVAVDLLFVIDNSPSMGKYQDALSAAFPGFVDQIFLNLPPGTDLHVGITTTSFFVGSCSESTNNCVSQSSESEIQMHYTPPTQMNNGENGGQGRLFNYQGMNYFAANTSDDPAALKAWFSGAATAAGEKGCSFEMAAAGAGWAADPANAGTNAGFIRDSGAVLLVFVLSDEPDKSPEPVSQFVDKLVAAKAECGGKKCILAAGLVNSFCYDNVGDTTLKTFLESFDIPPIIGTIGKIFPNDPEPDYTGVVGEALAQIIGQKCEEIGPPK